MDTEKVGKKRETKKTVRFCGMIFSSELDLAIKYFSSILVHSFF